MSKRSVVALDAMGGDGGPAMVVSGVVVACERYPDLDVLLFGDEARIKPLLDARPGLKGRAEIRHTDQAIGSDDQPAQALRRGRQSSMRLAINAVKDGDAQGVLSAGNTGALMAMAKFVLKTQSDIDRPAMISFFPTIRGESAMLDLGANVKCDAENLVQFAIMGAACARIELGIKRPTVGLLNVGVEDAKGNETVKLAGQMLRDGDFAFDFYGFVEGDHIGEGTVDVFVTDGFSGNVALKTAEGIARLYSSFLRESFQSSWLSKLGYLLAKPALNRLKAKVDPGAYNGAVFLGLNGVVVKSHGGTDAIGFANAIGVAVDMVRSDFAERISRDLHHDGVEPENSVMPESVAEPENSTKVV
ncbi:MAG: phosphate acyltransferase PlsX [Alphaproteobacteria bacterium]|nr:phosphate acyltransferase PlsX [Alphaproteobacteria bacterium]MBT4017841.1 phosphate acyltransferase PlsX [Alphaproteobacteria bacterium]MBT4965192.1 phosphate acyltransferase PlsX [Alphaproteobacteria bacterium]MBT5159677.1 phosphate acyltransferase PlsX [Alphaproteobacteria bacterium]MBT6384571.1 phosphate acyltransferase PlsX [Alphaproteobacteria bacterium]